MTRPATSARLTGPMGNNAFAYQQRKLIEPEPQLRLPALKHTSSIDDIELGTLPTFAELDDHDNVITYTGLKYIYHMEYCTDTFSCVPSSMDVKNYVPTGGTIPIYIFDNHNYALYFWTTYIINDAYNASLPVIHIDQHSDLGTPPKSLSRSSDGGSHTPLHDIAHYTTHICNVGNFIRPTIDAGIITDCLRIKNEYDLSQTGGSYPPLQNNTSQKSTKGDFILDIDLDFRAPAMGTDLTKSIPLVQSLMREASFITIASSPYFLDQEYALKLLSKLFIK